MFADGEMPYEVLPLIDICDGCLLSLIGVPYAEEGATISLAVLISLVVLTLIIVAVGGQKLATATETKVGGLVSGLPADPDAIVGNSVMFDPEANLRATLFPACAKARGYLFAVESDLTQPTRALCV